MTARGIPPMVQHHSLSCRGRGVTSLFCPGSVPCSVCGGGYSLSCLGGWEEGLVGVVPPVLSWLGYPFPQQDLEQDF